MKSVIRIFLKNGVQLPDIACDDFSVTCKNNSVIGYEYKGAIYPRPIHIEPCEIAAVYEMFEKEERPANRERCEYCRGAAYTPKPFKVITQTADVRDCVFNFCPVCGAELRGGHHGEQ